MSDYKILLIVLGIICLISGMCMIFIGTILTDHQPQKEIVPCYDKYGSRILGSQCLSEGAFDGSYIPLIVGGILVSFIGIFLIRWGWEEYGY